MERKSSNQRERFYAYLRTSQFIMSDVENVQCWTVLILKFFHHQIIENLS